ncbi:MAG TPA: MlaD family protein [Baekduia sp.]|uniref:MlaD family protein n=1 Tax=Baekduia sp. TaxID=2600305 RepID=UPI002B6A6478|nr:MlaD family protein [Baekduia sp.]HMJ37627.1 MlaD family protein [Baekduia sp.]
MRGVRKQMANAVWLVAMIVSGLLVGGYILGHQRLTWPSWAPLVGKDYFYLNARFSAAPGVLPGQGNAVTISGVKVGEITGDTLQDGQAVLKLRLDGRYGHVRPDATILLRPKTALKDMVAELDPGTAKAGPELRDGATLGVKATLPDVNFDEILAGLDGDTRAALVALLGNGATALGKGNGRELASTLRRFEPLSRHAAQASKLVAHRRVQLRRLMGNLSKLSQELGARDRDLGQFVSSSAAVFRHFSAQNDHLGQTLALLPGALQSSDKALGKLDDLGTTLRTGLTALRPGAASLGPTLKQTQPFLKQTAPVLRDSLRPFAREAQPTARRLVPAARDLAKATPDLDTLTTTLNALLDELAHDPPGNDVHGQSYLFNVPWANHNTNSAMASQDGIGPARHSLVLFSCGALQLLDVFADPKRNPTLSTVVGLLNAPKSDQCPPPK